MITIKSEKEIQKMREGGKILARIIKELKGMVKPGIITKELDKVAEDLVLKYNGKCSFKGYQEKNNNSTKPFPSCLCVSINEEIVHGIPSDRVLKEGDIISLDLGILFKDFHTDMAITVPVGKINSEVLRLIRIAKKALKRGIKKTRQGNTFGDIGNTIQRYVEDQGFNVVRDLCGHGIGRRIHEEPQVLNYGKRHKEKELKKGMVFCIEPMVVVGDWRIKKSKDGFGFQTADNSLSAHFEHTVAVTEKGAKILTELK